MILHSPSYFGKILGLKQSQNSLARLKWLVHSQPAAVLVVEDEALIRFAIIDDLEGAGFQVFEAANADSAITIIEDHPEIRVVFTDIEMPGTMDGMKLAAFVRGRWPPIKIIVTSGRIVPDAGCLPHVVPFFSKPYKPDHIINAMFAALND